MEFRGTLTLRRDRPISDDEYSRVLEVLNQQYEELGAVGCGGTRDEAVYVISTDRDFPYIAPLVNALKRAGLADAWVSIWLERIERDKS